MDDINGRKVAFLCTDGVEQIELESPWSAVEKAGGTPTLVGLKPDAIQAFQHLDKGDSKPVEKVVSDVSVDDFDALVLPGGVINGDFVRADATAVQFVKSFMDEAKPVAAICHGAWVLAEANAIMGKTMTSYPSLQTDLRNAGATWVDKPVVVDRGLVTSRKPADLPQFCEKLLEEVSEGVHAR